MAATGRVAHFLRSCSAPRIEQLSKFSRSFSTINKNLRGPTTWRLAASAHFYNHNLAKTASLLPVRFNSSLPVEQDIEKNARCVFVGGLEPGTMEDTVSNYFAQFGEIENVRLMKTFLGYSRNYGFVQFKDRESAAEVLKQKHLINGKTIDVGKSRNFRVVYVGGLPSHFTEDTIQNHFSKFGQVEAVKFIEHSKAKSRTGYAFITFATPEEANIAAEEENQEIMGSPVKVRPRSQESGEGLIAKALQSKKLMVRDLDFDSTVYEVQTYFEQFGELKGIDLLYNSENKTCAAVVFFRNLEDILKACQKEFHKIGGANASVTQVPNEEKQGIREKTVFVENLSEDTTEYGLRSYFRDFGHVAKVHILVDRETGKSRGYGVVKLRSPNTVDRIMECQNHVIGRSKVKVKRRGIKIRPHLNTDDLSMMNFDLSLSNKRR